MHTDAFALCLSPCDALLNLGILSGPWTLHLKNHEPEETLVLAKVTACLKGSVMVMQSQALRSLYKKASLDHAWKKLPDNYPV